MIIQTLICNKSYNLDMLRNKQFNAINLIQSLSETLELSNPGIFKHHLDVAYISKCIAEKINFDQTKIPNLIYAALIHDIGAALLWNEKQQIIINNNDDEIFEHTLEGYNILKQSKFFDPLAPFVKYHHHRYYGPNPDGITEDDIPLESRIIYLADRIDLTLNVNNTLHLQKEEINQSILNNPHFDPKLIVAFVELSKENLFWETLNHLNQNNTFTEDFISHNPTHYQMDDLISIAEIFSKLVDARSAFTARHSENVAKVAEYVALQLDYDANEAKRFYLAGLLHDLGKLIVSNEIIEKEGPLTEAEYDLIKQHSYYSQKVIMKIEGFKDIATLIGEHHERLDGSGYPNQLIGDEIKLPSRILQISDVFSALTEHRPYRHSLDNEEVISKMRSMTTLNQLDAHLMHLLENHVVHLRSLIDVKLVNVQDKKNTFFYDS